MWPFGFNGDMGLLSWIKKLAEPAPKEKPLLYTGALIEQSLYPLDEPENSARGKLLPETGTRAKNYWCTFSKRRQTTGKYAGSDVVQVLVDGKVIGELPPRFIAKKQDLMDALNSGINAATVFVYVDRETWGVRADLRLGEHKYMPKPYWEE